MRVMSRFLFAIVTAVLCMFGSAPSFATDVCTVQQSPDGFVAVRAEPSADSKELARALPGHALVIQQTDKGDQIEQGQWLKVFYYPGEIIPDTSDPEYKLGLVGWMHRSFVGDCG